LNCGFNIEQKRDIPSHFKRFTPLEKTADFNRRSLPLKADGSLKPLSAQTVRERSSLTGFIESFFLFHPSYFHKKPIIKIISFLLIISFTFQNILYANPDILDQNKHTLIPPSIFDDENYLAGVKAKLLIELVENGNGRTRENLSLDGVKAALAEAGQGWVAELQYTTSKGEILISFMNGYVLRYYNPSQTTHPYTNELVGQEEGVIDVRINRNLCRQIMKMKALPEPGLPPIPTRAELGLREPMAMAGRPNDRIVEPGGGVRSNEYWATHYYAIKEDQSWSSLIAGFEARDRADADAFGQLLQRILTGATLADRIEILRRYARGEQNYTIVAGQSGTAEFETIVRHIIANIEQYGAASTEELRQRAIDLSDRYIWYGAERAFLNACLVPQDAAKAYPAVVARAQPMEDGRPSEEAAEEMLGIARETPLTADISITKSGEINLAMDERFLRMSGVQENDIEPIMNGSMKEEELLAKYPEIGILDISLKRWFRTQQAELADRIPAEGFKITLSLRYDIDEAATHMPGRVIINWPLLRAPPELQDQRILFLMGLWSHDIGAHGIKGITDEGNAIKDTVEYLARPDNIELMQATHDIGLTQDAIMLAPHFRRVLFDELYRLAREGEVELLDQFGNVVRVPVKFRYYLLYKPADVLSTREDAEGLNRRTIYDILSEDHHIDTTGLYPVGRLDYDVPGVMILTDDPSMIGNLILPAGHIEKQYRVVASGEVTDDKKMALEEGVHVEVEIMEGSLIEYDTAPARIAIIERGHGTTTLDLFISEGKYRQVKGMMDAVGNPVIRMERIAIGPVTVSGMQQGDVKTLEGSDLMPLRQAQLESQDRLAQALSANMGEVLRQYLGLLHDFPQPVIQFAIDTIRNIAHAYPDESVRILSGMYKAEDPVVSAFIDDFLVSFAEEQPEAVMNNLSLALNDEDEIYIQTHIEPVMIRILKETQSHRVESTLLHRREVLTTDRSRLAAVRHIDEVLTGARGQRLGLFEDPNFAETREHLMRMAATDKSKPQRKLAGILSTNPSFGAKKGAAIALTHFGDDVVRVFNGVIRNNDNLAAKYCAAIALGTMSRGTDVLNGILSSRTEKPSDMDAKYAAALGLASLPGNSGIRNLQAVLGTNVDTDSKLAAALALSRAGERGLTVLRGALQNDPSLEVRTAAARGLLNAEGGAGIILEISRKGDSAARSFLSEFIEDNPEIDIIARRRGPEALTSPETQELSAETERAETYLTKYQEKHPEVTQLIDAARERHISPVDIRRLVESARQFMHHYAQPPFQLTFDSALVFEQLTGGLTVDLTVEELIRIVDNAKEGADRTLRIYKENPDPYLKCVLAHDIIARSDAKTIVERGTQEGEDSLPPATSVALIASIRWIVKLFTGKDIWQWASKVDLLRTAASTSKEGKEGLRGYSLYVAPVIENIIRLSIYYGSTFLLLSILHQPLFIAGSIAAVMTFTTFLLGHLRVYVRSPRIGDNLIEKRWIFEHTGSLFGFRKQEDFRLGLFFLVPGLLFSVVPMALMFSLGLAPSIIPVFVLTVALHHFYNKYVWEAGGVFATIPPDAGARSAGTAALIVETVANQVVAGVGRGRIAVRKDRAEMLADTIWHISMTADADPFMVLENVLAKLSQASVADEIADRDIFKRAMREVIINGVVSDLDMRLSRDRVEGELRYVGMLVSPLNQVLSGIKYRAAVRGNPVLLLKILGTVFSPDIDLTYAGIVDILYLAETGELEDQHISDLVASNNIYPVQVEHAYNWLGYLIRRFDCFTSRMEAATARLEEIALEQAEVLQGEVNADLTAALQCEARGAFGDAAASYSHVLTNIERLGISYRGALKPEALRGLIERDNRFAAGSVRSVVSRTFARISARLKLAVLPKTGRGANMFSFFERVEPYPPSINEMTTDKIAVLFAVPDRRGQIVVYQRQDTAPGEFIPDEYRINLQNAFNIPAMRQLLRDIFEKQRQTGTDNPCIAIRIGWGFPQLGHVSQRQNNLMILDYDLFIDTYYRLSAVAQEMNLNMTPWQLENLAKELTQIFVLLNVHHELYHMARECGESEATNATLDFILATHNSQQRELLIRVFDKFDKQDLRKILYERRVIAPGKWKLWAGLVFGGGSVAGIIWFLSLHLHPALVILIGYIGALFAFAGALNLMRFERNYPSEGPMSYARRMAVEGLLVGTAIVLLIKAGLMSREEYIKWRDRKEKKELLRQALANAEAGRKAREEKAQAISVKINRIKPLLIGMRSDDFRNRIYGTFVDPYIEAYIEQEDLDLLMDIVRFSRPEYMGWTSDKLRANLLDLAARKYSDKFDIAEPEDRKIRITLRSEERLYRTLRYVYLAHMDRDAVLNAVARKVFADPKFSNMTEAQRNELMARFLNKFKFLAGQEKDNIPFNRVLGLLFYETDSFNSSGPKATTLDSSGKYARGIAQLLDGDEEADHYRKIFDGLKAEGVLSGEYDPYDPIQSICVVTRKMKMVRDSEDLAPYMGGISAKGGARNVTRFSYAAYVGGGGTPAYNIRLMQSDDPNAEWWNFDVIRDVMLVRKTYKSRYTWGYGEAVVSDYDDVVTRFYDILEVLSEPSGATAATVTPTPLGQEKTPGRMPGATPTLPAAPKTTPDGYIAQGHIALERMNQDIAERKYRPLEDGLKEFVIEEINNSEISDVSLRSAIDRLSNPEYYEEGATPPISQEEAPGLFARIWGDLIAPDNNKLSLALLYDLPNATLREVVSQIENSQDFALGQNKLDDAENPAIYYSRDFLGTLPWPLKGEYILHEILCRHFGHQAARALQIVFFPANYPEGKPEGLLRDRIRVYIDGPRNFAERKEQDRYGIIFNPGDVNSALMVTNGWSDDALQGEDRDINGVVGRLNALPFIYTTWADAPTPRAYLELYSYSGEAPQERIDLYFRKLQSDKQTSSADIPSNNKLYVSFKADESNPNFTRFIDELNGLDGVEVVRTSEYDGSRFSSEWALLIEVPQDIIDAKDPLMCQENIEDKMSAIERIAEDFLRIEHIPFTPDGSPAVFLHSLLLTKDWPTPELTELATRFKNGEALTIAELQQLRLKNPSNISEGTYSYETVRVEISNLEQAGIVSIDRADKVHKVTLRPELARAPPREIVEAICNIRIEASSLQRSARLTDQPLRHYDEVSKLTDQERELLRAKVDHIIGKVKTVEQEAQVILPKEEDMIAGMPTLSMEPSQEEAVRLVASLRSLAKEAKDKGEELVVGIDTTIGNLKDYAPGLLETLVNLKDREGLENLRVITGEGTILSAQLNTYLSDAQRDSKTVRAVVIVKEDNRQKRMFKSLVDKAQVVSVDDSRVIDNFTGSLNYYIPIAKIIERALTKILSKPHEPIPYVEEVEEDGILKLILSVQEDAKPLEREELERRYMEESEFIGKA